MKKISMIALAFLAYGTTFAQNTFITKTGYVSFFSTTPVEDIKSENYKVISRLNTLTGELVFSIPIQSFEFEKALMQKHFNSKDFMDSKKYPKAKLKGRILNMDQQDLTKDGLYKVEIAGTLFIHGVEKDNFTTLASLRVEGGKIEGFTKFNLRVADFNIEMPSKKKDNLAEYVEVELKLNYQMENV